ncbi:MAG: efflux RND transporter periplasmic adaptor subunit [Hyphomicrobium sp.]
MIMFQRLVRSVISLTALALASGAGIAQSGPAPAPTVTVANPLNKRIATWDEYSGRFEAIESVEIRARVSGFIDKVQFKDGQIVKAGDPLYIIDPRPFQMASDIAKAEVARSKAQVELAENEVERARPLLKSSTVTERDFDQRVANLNVSRAQLQSAQASLKVAELNHAWTQVTAPVSGRISDSKVDVGNLVTGGPSGATLLTTIVSLAPIHFVFDVSESDYLRYARMNTSGERVSSRDTSNPVKVKLADEADFVHEGNMDFVDNQLNARSGTMRGRAVLANKDQLLQPGLFGRVKLFGGEIDALLVPDAAIVSDQMRKIVFLVGDGDTIVSKPVTLGPLYEGLRVIKSGLTVADRVVVDGIANPMVRPGAKITPKPGEIKQVTN